MFANRLAAVSQHFHEFIAANPFAEIFQPVNLPLTFFARRATDSNVFQRAAEAAHCVPFEMRQNNHRVVIVNVRAHRDFFKMKAVANRKVNVAFLVQNIDRAKRPAVLFQNVPMPFSRRTHSAISNIRLDNRGVRNLRLKNFHHIGRQNVRSIRLAGVKFDSDFAGNVAVNFIVKCD